MQNDSVQQGGKPGKIRAPQGNRCVSYAFASSWRKHFGIRHGLRFFFSRCFVQA
jgi:hypothetical protein